MNADTYQESALSTASAASFHAPLVNGALGLAGEGGEVADLVKKWEFQGHPLTPEKLVEELGDVLWYVALISNGLGFTLSQVMEANLAKLAARYPDGHFAIERSLVREEPRD